MIKTIVKGVSISLLCSTLYANAGPKSNSNNLYVRAGTGLSFDNARFKESAVFDRRAPRNFQTFHIGIGYRLHDSFRADLILQYSRAKYRVTGRAADERVIVTKQHIRTHAAFINGYYDASLSNSVVSYLTAGIGLGHNRTSNVISMIDVNLPRGTSRTNFIWNVGAGLQFKVNKNFAVDLGYRYMDLGTARTLAGGGPLYTYNVSNPMRGQNIMASLIYKF